MKVVEHEITRTRDWVQIPGFEEWVSRGWRS
jgi:hypothetical protein